MASAAANGQPLAPALPIGRGPMHWEAACVHPTLHQISVMPATWQFKHLPRQAGLAARRNDSFRTTAFHNGCVGLKYVFDASAVVDGIQVYKYLYCRGDHAIIVREVQELTMDFHVQYFTQDEQAQLILRDSAGHTVCRENVPLDQDTKLGDALPALRQSLNRCGRLSLPGKLRCKFNGKEIAGRKLVVKKKTKAFCMHDLKGNLRACIDCDCAVTTAQEQNSMHGDMVRLQPHHLKQCNCQRHALLARRDDSEAGLQRDHRIG